MAVFTTSDLEKELRYYCDVLQFTIDFQHDRYAGLKIGEGGFLHLQSIGTRAPGAAYFFCDEVDAYYEAIRKKGALLQNQPQDYSYGMRDFSVLDHHGNRLTFGCPTGPVSED